MDFYGKHLTVANGVDVAKLFINITNVLHQLQTPMLWLSFMLFKYELILDLSCPWGLGTFTNLLKVLYSHEH